MQLKDLIDVFFCRNVYYAVDSMIQKCITVLCLMCFWSNNDFFTLTVVEKFLAFASPWQ